MGTGQQAMGRGQADAAGSEDGTGQGPPVSRLPLATGTLTKFTLVLYGTASESTDISNRIESSGCKTLASSQACVGECGHSWGGGEQCPGRWVVRAY